MDSILEQVLKVQSESYNTTAMEVAIIEIAASFGCKVTEHKGNLYITKGIADNYNCIVAHTDTVHDIIPDKDYQVVEVAGRVFAYDMGIEELTGIGGDDKVGVAIALTALRDLEVIKVAFFRDEEVGGLGSKDANMKFFDDCNFVLQCDRKGNSGIVNNIYGEVMFDQEFALAIAPITKQYGYKEVSGMFTDVYQLALNGLPVACANIECGYYNPHQPNEYIDLKDYERCKAMTLHLLSTLTDRYEVNRDVKKSLYDKYEDYAWDKYHDWCWECQEYAEVDSTEMLCDKCMDKYFEEEKKEYDYQPELFSKFDVGVKQKNGKSK